VAAETSVAIASSVRFFLVKANCGSGGRSKRFQKDACLPPNSLGIHRLVLCWQRVVRYVHTIAAWKQRGRRCTRKFSLTC
jgi:hypothetical protein